MSAQGLLCVANRCNCTHTPRSALDGLISQPAVVHALPSVYVHDVLVFGEHFQAVMSQPSLHSFAHEHCLVPWYAADGPLPFHVAVVHACPPPSAHGVLDAANR